jgi:exopolysaccharide biosynthesis polyprenyl glycosylphosphotransferase
VAFAESQRSLRAGGLKNIARDDLLLVPSRVDAAPVVRFRYIKQLLLAGDLLAAFGAMAVAYLIRSWLNFEHADVRLEATRALHMRFAILALPGFAFFFFQQRLYSARFLARRIDELRRVTNAVIGGVVVMIVMGYATKTYLSRTWFISIIPLGVAFSMVSRECARRTFRSLRLQGAFLRSVVIVGTNTEGMEIYRMLNEDPTLGYKVVALIDDRGQNNVRKTAKATAAETLATVREYNASSVIIAATALDVQVSNRLIRQLVDEGVHVELSSALSDIAAERLTVRPLGRIPILYLEPVHRTGWRPLAKRTFDVLVSATSLLILAIPMAVVALLVRLDSPGPVFFSQERLGMGGKRFRILKFRSMVAGAELKLAELKGSNEADGPLFKIKEDPRITRVGGVLRKLSIDEIPQLINVLKGEMSLVGPRPALPSERDHWPEELHNRLHVRPGITGMWQVHGRSDASFEEYTRLDLYYVDNWSLLTDLVIMAKTIPAVLLSRGAR